MWNKKPTRCHLVLHLFLSISPYLFLSISPYKWLNMFRATLCPSSGADDLVVVRFLFHIKYSALNGVIYLLCPEERTQKPDLNAQLDLVKPNKKIVHNFPLLSL